MNVTVYENKHIFLRLNSENVQLQRFCSTYYRSEIEFFCPYSSYVHLRNLFHHTRLHTTDEDHSFEVTFCKSVGNILLLKSVNQTLFSQKNVYTTQKYLIFNLWNTFALALCNLV